MVVHEPCLESDLTLTQLATRIGLSAHHLSQLFNEHLRQTFLNHINARRVEDVKRCLSLPAMTNLCQPVQPNRSRLPRSASFAIQLCPEWSLP